ncbi:MAG: phenylalanine--tRNA ligase subunit beta, partial [Candidatus Hadarchaeota archaeon]|nr:phenylalanine--tRNA ligase subunit beta [Candidatus Hadarchaeota archaeon]
GVARALKGFLRVKTGLPKYRLRKPKLRLEVDPSVKGVRPYIVAGVVEGVKLDEASLISLMDVQEKLHATLARDRTKISIGAYDLDKVKPPIRYTTTLPDATKFVPLDFDQELTPAQILRRHPKGIEYAHLIQGFKRYPLLVDAEDQVLSMPPIINSEPTRVTESTGRLVIDVTGIDERTAHQALVILMTGLGERGFKLCAVKVEYPDRSIRTPRLRTSRRRLNVGEANRTLGLDLKARQVAGIMERMCYGVSGVKGSNLTVVVPPYRDDVMHEIDLIEDLAIGYGYGRLEPTLPPIATAGESHPVEVVSDKARRVLTGLGFMEAMTFTLTNPRTNFELMRAKGEAAVISNPVSEEYTILRTWLLPCLLDVLRENKRHELPQRIFEVGDVVLLDRGAETGARNVRRAAAAIIGDQANLTHVKAVAEALLRELGISWKVKPIEHSSFLRGRAAELLVKGRRLGILGEVHPEVILGFELEHPVAAFELELPR